MSTGDERRRVLHAVADAFFPALRPDAGDDPTLFHLDAAALGVADALDPAIGALSAAQRREFERLIGLLEQPLVMGWLAHQFRPFTGLAPEARERALLAMARSSVPQLRAGFQALKRLTTFLAYSLPGAGTSPTWRPIGYRPSGNRPAAPAVLRLTRVTTPLTLEADVCVIGSGAGGGVAAAELARGGRRVVVLEAGGGWQAPDFDQHELAGMERLYLDRGTTATRDVSVAILAGGALGGGTTVNWQTSLRTPDAVRDEWTERSGCRHFSDESFSRSLDLMSARIGVSSAESVVNGNNAALRRGCDALGYHHTLIERNASGCDAAQCGYCVYGCRHGGKQTTAVTFLADAQRDGDATIIPDCRAERVRWAGGRATGVAAWATDPATGVRHAVDVRAPVVVVACGSIESPTLLLRSGLRLPAIGRHLLLHPTTAVAGYYTEPVEPWLGPPQTVLCDQFAALDGGYGFRLEAAPVHPGLLAIATPWHGARAHRRRMRRAAHTAATIVLTRDRGGGRVTLDGEGRAVIDYRPGRIELDFLRRGMTEAARIHLAAGATDVVTLHTREHACRATDGAAALEAFCGRVMASAFDRNRGGIFSAHQMGTCRMGSDPARAVCGADGEVFGLPGLFIADASAFPASSGVNPMVTIMALAHHTAGRILAR